MTAAADRLDLRLSVDDKERIRCAAALHGVPLATFVRQAALREAEALIGSKQKSRSTSLAARMRGRATAGMSTDEILQLTRDA